jgi:predicted Fe-Mo cluster-binding NifX family protein
LSGRKILRSRVAAPPPHEPGSFPRWLRERGVQVIIVGSIGQRALDNLLHQGIEVRTGRPGATVEILLADYLGENCLRCKTAATISMDRRRKLTNAGWPII